jgi:molybdopterin synthase sulfur carrier subunit
MFGHTLREAVGESEIEVEIATPTSVKAILEANQEKLGGALGLANKGEIVVAVNKKVGSLDSIVNDGDTVKLTHQFNPIFEGATWQNP